MFKKAHDEWFPAKVLSKGGEVKRDVDGRRIGATKLKGGAAMTALYATNKQLNRRNKCDE